MSPRNRRVAALLAALLVGRLADTVTTVYGLSRTGVEESNPVPAAAIAELGTVAGLVAVNVLAVGAVVVATELGVHHTRRHGVPDHRVLQIRALGYVPYAAVSFGAAGYNALLLATI